MKTGAEIVLEWFRKYSEQNGTPTPFEIRCQLELAIEHDKTELKKFRLGYWCNIQLRRYMKSKFRQKWK